MNKLKFTGLVIKFNNTDIDGVYWIDDIKQ